jgi:hypothetical protein
MQPGYVCLAGIDSSTGRHVRPVARGRRLRRSEILVSGSELRIGSEVDLGRVIPVPHPPETEDHDFSPAAMTRVRDLAPADLRARLDAAGAADLSSTLGAHLEADGHTASAPIGSPGPSLGCLIPAGKPRLEVAFGSLKLLLEDAGRPLRVAVTDLRLFEADEQTPDRATILRVNRLIEAGDVYLSVGLTRPFTKPGETRVRHWLQINNVHVFPGYP